MAASGRISVLVSDELQTLLSAARELPKEVNAATRLQTKRHAAPVWEETVRGHTITRMQVRVLSDTARVGVTDSNVFLRSGGIGKMSSGIPKSSIAFGVEFGADRNFVRSVTNARGTTFKRHTKRQFQPPRSGGYVVYPAAREAIPRLGSLWFQTAVRTIHETFERQGGVS